MKSLLTILLSSLLALPLPQNGENQVEITLGPQATAALQNAPSRARLILFFGSGRIGAAPADGPFPFQPAPIASWALSDPTVEVDLDEGTIRATSPSAFYPADLNELDGTFRVQAVIDIPSPHPGHRAPGDLVGPTEIARLEAARDDTIELTIDACRHDGARK